MGHQHTVKGSAISAIVLLLVLPSHGSDFFPIGAYHVYLDKFDQAHSAHFNTVHRQRARGDEQSYLDSAAAHGLRAIVEHYPDSRSRNLWTYTHIHRAVYESERGVIPFEHATGQLFHDANATGDTAWWCAEGIHGPGLIQYGGYSRYETPPTSQYYEDSLKYTASFRLRVGSPSLRDTTVICRLFVEKAFEVPAETTVLVADALVRLNSFADSTYRYIELEFSQGKSDPRAYYTYSADWCGRDTVWLDHVEVRDQRWDSLIQGLYDPDLCRIVTDYADNEALFRWYLADEPSWNLFSCSKYVSKLLDAWGVHPGASAVSGIDWLRPYTELVAPQQVWVDIYPLMGFRSDAGRTPVDSGRTFQDQLDLALCSKLAEARRVAKSAGVPLWFTPQAFGDSIPAGDSLRFPEYERLWREPTPRELSCMVWLSLAYGAKGIIYYHYPVSWERDHWVLGLVNRDGSPREPKWERICSLNAELSLLAPVLLGLSSDTVFRSDDIPANTWITDISDSLVQAGLFHDSAGGHYCMLVNRHCGVRDTLSVTVGAAGVEGERWLEDVLTGEVYSTKDGTFRRIRLLPGGGRLFKLR